MELPKPLELKLVFTSEHNSDRTEGRGRNLIAGVFESESDALAHAKGNDVQGTNGRVRAAHAFRLSSGWVGPVSIVSNSEGSKKLDEILAAKRAALQKAKDAGLSDDEIKLLR